MRKHYCRLKNQHTQASTCKMGDPVLRPYSYK